MRDANVAKENTFEDAFPCGSQVLFHTETVKSVAVTNTSSLFFSPADQNQTEAPLQGMSQAQSNTTACPGGLRFPSQSPLFLYQQALL